MKTPEEVGKEEREERRALMIERFTQSALTGLLFNWPLPDVPSKAINLAIATVDELLRRFPSLAD